MRLLAGLFALSLLGTLAQSGCNSAEQKNQSAAPTTAAAPAPTFADGVRRVTTAELKALLDKNEAVVIDVRNEASFKAGHIPGSKLIPDKEVINRTAELPKNKLIVTYCS